jgi:hypothetical protein
VGSKTTAPPEPPVRETVPGTVVLRMVRAVPVPPRVNVAPPCDKVPPLNVRLLIVTPLPFKLKVPEVRVPLLVEAI